MKVAGFTIIKNAVTYGYPVVESILSALPICDVFYVAVGDSLDGTKELIESIGSEKIIVVDSVWDPTKMKNGEILAIETNKMFQLIPSAYDWCFYIQADEMIHENDYTEIINTMQRELNNKQIDGLLFDYYHFWGSYNYVGATSKWYRKEIRIVRNNKSIFSYKDAQGFRKDPNEKLNVAAVKAHIYHYGWVRPPAKMQAKYAGIQQYWSNEDKYIAQADEFDYDSIDDLNLFKGSHPIVMKDIIAQQNWEFVFDKSKIKITAKERFKRLLTLLTGKHFFEYRNYILVK